MTGAALLAWLGGSLFSFPLGLSFLQVRWIYGIAGLGITLGRYLRCIWYFFVRCCILHNHTPSLLEGGVSLGWIYTWSWEIGLCYIGHERKRDEEGGEEKMSKMVRGWRYDVMTRWNDHDDLSMLHKHAWACEWRFSIFLTLKSTHCMHISVVREWGRRVILISANQPHRPDLILPQMFLAFARFQTASACPSLKYIFNSQFFSFLIHTFD